MPYLKEKFRNEISNHGELTALKFYVSSLKDEDFPAALNFVIHSLVKAWLGNKKLTYLKLNTVLGAIEAAKLEIYRVIAATYENEKRSENGDV